MKYADYQIKLKDNSIICKLCPHECRISIGNTGICNVRKNINGSLYSLNYGKAISYSLDPIEKKPFARFYPGTMISSIGTYGCNLKCDFCQNHELVNYKGPSREIDPKQIIDMIIRDNSIGLAYTYNEPTIWYEFVLEMSKLIKKYNLFNVLVTNGFINKEPFIRLAKYIDAMNIDLKSINPNFYKYICGADPKYVIQTIEKAVEMGIHVEVSTLLISGLNTSNEEIKYLVETISQIDNNIPLHLSRYFPAYKRNDPPTLIRDMYTAYEIAKKKLKYVYLGNI